MIKGTDRIAGSKKYPYKGMILTWKSAEKAKADKDRILRAIKRAEFMIKFWQEEVKYLKEEI